MPAVEIPQSVQRLVTKQQKLLQEGIDRINRAQLTKFDRIQMRRALSGSNQEKQQELLQEITQKIIGPDYQMKVIKTGYGQLRELADLGLQRYAMYHQLLQPSLQQMFFALQEKGTELMQSVLDDPSLDKYDEGFAGD